MLHFLCWITHSESLFLSISIQRITVFYWSPCSRGIPKQNPFFRFLLSGYLQDGVTLPSRNTVRNFGVIFDQYISFSAYNKHICRTAFLYLCNIWRRSTFKQSINHSLKMSLATNVKQGYRHRTHMVISFFKSLSKMQFWVFFKMKCHKIINYWGHQCFFLLVDMTDIRLVQLWYWNYDIAHDATLIADAQSYLRTNVEL